MAVRARVRRILARVFPSFRNNLDGKQGLARHFTERPAPVSAAMLKDKVSMDQSRSDEQFSAQPYRGLNA